ncbi:hypothetical protein ACSBLW_09940 [Thioclava sp. FR2]|uniref:hypothetical protein n=1 Tax=Thioclava sp. FR2 TaxID=3445780 RepID=UPI003EBDDB17
MQLLRLSDQSISEVKSLFEAVLVTAEGALGTTGRRLMGLKAQVDVRDQLFDVLSDLTDDPRLADVIVVDCDGYGGLEAVQRALGRLCQDDRRAPVILISSECKEQVFPQRRSEPVCLRAPVSSVAMRVAMETTLQSKFPHVMS